MIGIFDSGIGGLTVVRALRALLPDAPLLYFGDTARTPYGNKGPATIRRFALEDAAFLRRNGATVFVIACNTMSAVAVEAIRKQYPDVPLFDVITPAVAAAVIGKPKRVGVIGTRATIGSSVYEQRLQQALPGLDVVVQPCPLLVPLVEEGALDTQETRRITRRYLAPVKQRGPQALILGCTHYPFLKDIIRQKMGGRVRIIDSAEVTAAEVAAYVHQHPDAVGAGHEARLFFSDLPAHTKKIATEWAGANVDIISVPIEEIEGKI